jgi:arsenate reductase-like glutaredoxin family protein
MLPNPFDQFVDTRSQGRRHCEIPLTSEGAIITIYHNPADPTVIERPIVITKNGVRLCRPPESVRKILP